MITRSTVPFRRRPASVHERSDIQAVMDTFGCDENRAVELINAGINVAFIKEGVDKIVEPELRLGDDAKDFADRLSDTIAELDKDV